MANRLKFTTKKRDDLLALLRTGNTISFAAAAIGVSRRCIYDHREADAEFCAAMDEALEEGGEALEQEAFRRAVEGSVRYSFSRDGEVLEERQYSDTLLIFLLKGRLPEKYRERIQQETHNSGDIRVTIAYARPGSEGDISPAASASAGVSPEHRET